MTRTEVELHAYVHQLEEHLRLAVFGGDAADPESAVLLVRGALAADDQARAADLAGAMEKLTGASSAVGDMAAAGAHVRGLVGHDPAALEWAALAYSSPLGWESLTDTERRIVTLVAQGCSNRQIASQMFLSVHTIAFHLRRVFCKLDVTSRVQLASLAAEQAREGAGSGQTG